MIDADNVVYRKENDQNLEPVRLKVKPIRLPVIAWGRFSLVPTCPIPVI
ncbi:hypothetical protein VCHA53O466_150014 [Vibrio chagasii]|nr:hypothetical protein VCHA53O466_150014 [Vibrio chagasii]